MSENYNVWMGWINFESGYDYGTVQALSRIQTNGHAYGQYQFDYQYGLVPFMQYCIDKYPIFSGFSPYIALGAGNPALINNTGLHNLFINYAINHTADFLAAQNACAIVDYLKPAIDYISNNYGYDIQTKGAVVLGSLWSMAIRSGYVTAAQKYAGYAGMDALQIINLTYDTYGDSDANRWANVPGSQREKAINALTTGDDIYIINSDGGGGIPPTPVTGKKGKWIYYWKRRRNDIR